MARSGVWNGMLSFGLLNIPVMLKSANEDKSIHFSMLDEHDLSPIKYRKFNANTDKEVPYDKIVKGYEYKKDKYVIMSSADFKAANPKATQTVEIEDFVDLDQIDLMFFEKPYYVLPQKNGGKSYALLRDALTKTRKVAIGKIVMHTKQRLVAIFPRDQYLILEVLRFSHELLQTHEAKLLSKSDNYTDREFKMAQRLVEEMSSKWNPDKYKDTYYNDLMKRIQAKVKQGKAHTIVKEKDVETVQPSKVVDLLPLLRRSLSSPKSEHSASRPKKRARG